MLVGLPLGSSHPLRIESALESEAQMAGGLTAETLEDARSLVRLDVECRWPECFRANLVGQAIDGRTELVDPVVDFVEARLGLRLRFDPESHAEARVPLVGGRAAGSSTGNSGTSRGLRHGRRQTLICDGSDEAAAKQCESVLESGSGGCSSF